MVIPYNYPIWINYNIATLTSPGTHLHHSAAPPASPGRGRCGPGPGDRLLDRRRCAPPFSGTTAEDVPLGTDDMKTIGKTIGNGGFNGKTIGKP